jgi:long-chain acyl-CoA synthetase
MKITEKIFESLSAWGDYPACIEMQPDNTAVPFSALKIKEDINDMSHMLMKQGIMKGSIVILFLNNSVDFITVFLGLIDIGAIPIPVNMAYRKIELDEIFSNADPHAIMAELDHTPIIRDYMKNRIVITRERGKFTIQAAERNAENREPADIDESIASINYTYRGYGYPLGAMVPHAQYLFGSQILQEAVKLNEGERLLVILPMQHIFTLIGCVFLPLLYHVTSVISHRRNPLRLFELIKEHDIHYILAVPEVYELFLKLKDPSLDISNLKAFLSGGSVLMKDHFSELMDAYNVDLIHGYGLTEFTPISRNMRGSIRPGTIGTVSRGVDCMIDSPDERGLGEIMIKTGHMTRGYYKRERETAEAFDNGWFRTGDIGRLEDGWLMFEHEKKGTRKVRGNMVDLEEVKKALLMYPDVVDALVEHDGNTLSSAIKIESTIDFKSDVVKIKNFLEDSIAGYKVPNTITER